MMSLSVVFIFSHSWFFQSLQGTYFNWITQQDLAVHIRPATCDTDIFVNCNWVDTLWH